MTHVEFPSSQNNKSSPLPPQISNSDQKPSFLALKEDEYAKIATKVEGIRPLIHLEKRTTADIRSVAKSLGKSVRTVYRYIEKYNDWGGAEGLLRPKTFGGGGKSRMDRYAEAIFQQLFEEIYLSQQKPRIKSFYQQYHAICSKHRIKEIPSYWTIYRRIKSQDDRLAIKSRLGIEAFKEKYHIGSGNFNDNKFPLQTVMIDHTKLDVILVDDSTGKVIGRPWLTIALDAYSRCVWAYYLGIQTPNADIVGLTIRMGCLRKDNIVSMFRLHEWPVFGIPFQIHTDNGKDFRSRLLERGCLANGITLERRPIKQPQYGSYIERFFRTLNTKLIHNLPGTTFSNIKDRGKYESEKKAILTIQDLEELILKFIVNQYHNEVNKNLGTTPLKKWKEGLHQFVITPEEPKNVERFRQDFLCYVEPDGQRVIERDGVHFKGLAYYASELQIISKYKGKSQKKYFIRYDPSDLRYLYLFDDDRNRYYKLYLKTRPSHAISLRRIESARKLLKKQGSNDPDEELVIETILHRQEFLRNLPDSKKALRKAAAERRTEELRKRSFPSVTDQKQSPEQPVEFNPKSIDVNSARIIHPYRKEV